MKVSVVITSYNHDKYISKSIESFLNQTFQDFEIIIIDDASKDKSVEIIKTFKDPRIKLFALEKNGGVSNATNIGIKEAKGEYIKIFASDDIANPDLLEKQVSFLDKNPEHHAVFSRMEVIDENDKSLCKKTQKFDRFFLNTNQSNGEWLNHFFFKGNCLAAPTAMVRKEILQKVGGFDRRFIQAHDFDLWVRICLERKNIYVLDERLVKYRRICNNGNLSSNTDLVRKRLVFDNEKLLVNFLSIKNIDFLLQIFPNLESERSKITVEIIPFLIAREALRVTNSIHHRQLAISAIFDVLKNEDNVIKLEKDFNFTITKDFMNIVNHNPLGDLFEISNTKPKYKLCVKKIGNKIKNFLAKK